MTDNPFDQFDSAPRGIRNNNPLNLTGSKWQGQTGDDGRFAQFDTPEAGRAAADANLVAYHQKHGLNTVSGIVNRWAPPSENDTGAYASTVAKKVGVDPNQPLDMTDPSVRYKLLDAMQEQETGQKAVNPFDQFEADAPPPEVTAYVEGRPDLGVGVAHAPQARPAAPPKPRGALPQIAQRQGPTIAQDAWSGFVQPFKDAGRTIADEYHRSVNKRAPTSLSELGQGVVADLTGAPKMLWQVATALPAGIMMAGVRPSARALNRTLPAPSVQDKSVLGLKYGPYRKLTDPNERQAFFENSINTALSGASPARTKAPAVKPLSLGQLKDANTKAWAQVDASGYRFPQSDVHSLAKDVRQLVNDAGPELYPEATKVANRIEDLAKRGQLTPAQANRLRTQVGEKLLGPGSTEVSVGGDIKAKIDGMIDGAANASADLKAARQTHTQYVKMREVSDRLADAELNKAAAGNGGNPNATRQAIKPLLKKKGTQAIRNFTPDETKAARRLVYGSKLTRAASAFDPFQSKLAALIQGGLGIKTGGLSALSIPVGIAASAADKASTAGRMQQLLDLISVGGVNPARPGLDAIPRIPIKSARGLIGAGVTAAPLARIPAERQPVRKTASSGRK